MLKFQKVCDKNMFKIDNSFLELLNNEELKAIINDDTKFEDMLKDLKQAKDIETEKEILLASNRSLAEFNLSKEPELVLVRQQLQELNRTGESLYKSIEEKSSGIKKRNGCNNMETVLELLQTAAAEMEEESENIAESFLGGDTDVEGFLEQFTSRRKLMHLRRVKADKMTEMVQRRMAINTATPALRNSNMQNYPSFYQPPPPIAAVPYTVGPTMPVPTYPLSGQF